MAFHRAGVYGLNFGLDSDNILRIGGWSAPANLWQLDMSGNSYNYASSRATVFYDVNDTTYYGDFASTADNALKVRGGAMFGPNTTWGEFLYVGTNGNPTTSSASVCSTNGNLHLDAKNGQVIYLNNYSTSSYTEAAQSMRSPIFYDVNNTAYNGNFAGRSFFYELTLANSNTFLYLGNGEVSTTNQIGISWANDTYAIFKPYGAWIQPLHIAFHTGIKIGAQSVYGGTRFYNTEGMVSQIFSVGDGDNAVRAYASMRAPIFYDQDDTGYYVDPNGTTSLAGVVYTNQHYIRGGYALQGEPGGWTGEQNKIQWHSSHMYFQNTSDGNFTFRQANGNEPFILTIGGAYGTAQGSWRAPYFFDSNNTAYYIDLAGTGASVYAAGDIYCGMAVNNSSIYMGDTDQGTRRIHCNSERIGFLNQADGWGSYCTDAGDWVSETVTYGYGSIRAPVFYDIDNTGYYCDPTGYSQFAGTLALGGSFSGVGSAATIRVHLAGGAPSDSNTGIAAAWNVHSDYRLKENVLPVTDGLEKIMQVQVKSFTWKHNLPYIVTSPIRQDGVIAHEIQEIFPYAVMGEKDAVDANGNIRSQAVDYAKLVSPLIQAVQDLKRTIDLQQVEINELKASLNLS